MGFESDARLRSPVLESGREIGEDPSPYLWAAGRGVCSLGRRRSAQIVVWGWHVHFPA